MNADIVMPSDSQTIHTDRLMDIMLARQAELSATVGVNNLEEEERFRSTLSQLCVEASEALAPFLNTTKPWKTTSVDYEHVDEEVIDILHYVLTYFNLRNLSQEDIFQLYLAKNTHNFKRVREKIAAMQPVN